MARRPEAEEPVVHQGVSGEPHMADWSSWRRAEMAPATRHLTSQESRSCGVRGCGRHQARPRGA